MSAQRFAKFLAPCRARVLLWLLGALALAAHPAHSQISRVEVALQGWWRGETNGFATSLARFGNYVALANRKAGAEILDVSNPTAPGSLANHGSPGEPDRIVISAGRAYLVGLNNGLEVLDLNDALHPVLLGQYAAGQSLGGIAVAGANAYVGLAQPPRLMLKVLDVSNPAQIVERASLPFFTNAFAAVYDVEISENLAYVGYSGEFDGGLVIIDITNPTSPTLRGRLSALGLTPYDLSIASGHAWIADPFAGLRAADVRNPSSPTLVSSQEVDGSLWGIQVRSSRAYLATGAAGVQVFDVANPAAPVWLAGATGPGSATGIAVDGEMLYVAAGREGLLAYSVRESPAVTGFNVGAGNTLILNWNPPAEGMKLQVATDSALTNWIDVPNSELTNRIVIPMSAPSGIFRLIRP